MYVSSVLWLLHASLWVHPFVCASLLRVASISCGFHVMCMVTCMGPPYIRVSHFAFELPLSSHACATLASLHIQMTTRTTEAALWMKQRLAQILVRYLRVCVLPLCECVAVE